MAKKPKQPDSLVLPLPANWREKSCASQYFGKWWCESRWFASTVQAVQNGTLKPREDAGTDDEDKTNEPVYQVRNHVAVFTIDGMMTKKGSSFGGCSTIKVRQALRAAAQDHAINRGMLYVCSPGGTAEGTADLAEDIMAFRMGTLPGATGPKPIDGYAADYCCSAAYFAISQCNTITANTTCLVGNIGTYCVLTDTTGAQEQMGVSYTVVANEGGTYKGLGADGKITDALKADVQRENNELNAPFLAAVAAGRKGKINDMSTVSDGRAHVSPQAKALGLIDAVSSFDSALTAAIQESNAMTTEMFQAHAAEHPEAVAPFVEQGKKAGSADAHKAEVERMKAIAASCGGDYELAVNSFVQGQDAATVKLAADHAAKVQAAAAAKAQAAKAEADAKESEHKAALAAQAKEIEQLKAAVGTQGTVGMLANKPQTASADAPADNPKAQAEKEWDDNTGGCQSKFADKEVYTKTRLRELQQ